MKTRQPGGLGCFGNREPKVQFLNKINILRPIPRQSVALTSTRIAFQI